MKCDPNITGCRAWISYLATALIMMSLAPHIYAQQLIIIDAICPSVVSAGSGQTTVNLYERSVGQNLGNFGFVQPKLVRFTKQGSSPAAPLNTLPSNDSTYVTVSLNAAMLATPATYQVDFVSQADINGAGSSFVSLSNPVLFTVVPAPVITGLDPSAVTQGSTAVNVTVRGANFIPAVPTPSTSLPFCPAGSSVQINGNPAGSMQVVSTTEIVTSIPADVIGAAAGGVNVVVANGTVVSKPFNLIVNRRPTIDAPATLPDGVVGRPYPGTQIVASGGTEPLAWSITPGNLGLTITPAGTSAVISGTPSTAGTFSITAQALDQSSVTASRVYTLNVYPAATLALTLPPTTVPPNQSNLQITGPSGYPVPITGQLQISFQPSPDLKANVNTPDPTMSLSSQSFTIDPRTGVAAVSLAPGTSSGTVTVRAVNVTAGGIDIGSASITPAVTVVASGPPVITGCTQNRTTSALSLNIIGYSSTREVTRATFLFSPASGEELSTTRIVRDDAGSALFGPYYSAQFSSFRYDQTFIVNGSTKAIGSVSVTLDNSKGASQTVNCN